MIRLLVSSSCGFDYLLKDFHIVRQAEYTFYNGKYHTNFDAVYCMEHNMDELDANLSEICLLNNIPVFGKGNRFTKHAQSGFLTKFGINNITSIYAATETGIAYCLSKENIKPNENLVIKLVRGAKGVGQFRTKSQDISNTFYYLHQNKSAIRDYIESKNIDINTDDEEIEVCYEDDITSDLDLSKPENYNPPLNNVKEKFNDKDIPKHILESINDLKKNSVDYAYHIPVHEREATIQKQIDIKDEYRCLYGYKTKPLIYKRVRNGWQVDTSLRFDLEHEFVENHLDILPEDFFSKVDDMLLFLKIPFISLDIYVDNNNEVGVIEFSQQFRANGFLLKHDVLCDNMNESFMNMYNYLIKR